MWHPATSSNGYLADVKRIKTRPSMSSLMTVNENDARMEFQQKATREENAPRVARSATVNYNPKTFRSRSLTLLTGGDGHGGHHVLRSSKLFGPGAGAEKACKSHVNVADSAKTSEARRLAKSFDSPRNSSESSLGLSKNHHHSGQGKHGHLLRKVFGATDDGATLQRRDAFIPEPRKASRKDYSSGSSNPDSTAVDIVIAKHDSADIYFVRRSYNGGFGLCRGKIKVNDDHPRKIEKNSSDEPLLRVKSPATDMGIQIPSMKRQYLALGENDIENESAEHMAKKKSMEQFERWMLLG